MIRLIAVFCFTISAAFSQGSLLCVGGGSEDYRDWSDTPYRWFVTHAPNAHILVLNYEDTTSFFTGYFPWLSPCTVKNLAITSRAQANDSSLYNLILQFDGIFLRGGDQWQYVSLWRETLVQEAIRQVFKRGGVVGGTSAGEAVLSEIVFDAQRTSVSPRGALRNPSTAGITLTDNFLGLGENMLCDSHFFERGRLGRLPAFMAYYKTWKGREIVGVGVDYNTALAIDPDGVGEVMGAGTVTVLRYCPDSRTTYLPGEQLSMSNILFDQLTVGSTISLSTGDIAQSASAFPYAPVPWAMRAQTVILDGSNSSDWFGDGGSVRKLIASVGGPTDTVGIISSPSSPSAAVLVESALSSWGTPSKTIWLNAETESDSATAASVSGCRKFIFAGNKPDSLGRFLDSTSLSGRAFSGCLKSGAALLFLGDDMIAVGPEGIGQMYKSDYAAYYGYLTCGQGLTVLAGLQCVPRLFENSAYTDNRASAVFWSMVLSHVPYGLLLDNGTHVVLSDNRLYVYGTTPVMLIDARLASWGSLPEFRDPGKLHPRQNGGMIGAKLHIIRSGEVFDLAVATDVKVQRRELPVPERNELLQLYPNPFNGTTVIRYQIPAAGRVQLSVCDLLGREVALLVNTTQNVGMSSVQFNGSRLASGVYYCRLMTEAGTKTVPLLLIR